ncbi:MAG: Hsp20/alpha crystallin family protein [Candidatus ainarchaeum sp.]|nr:Hsp20/alpha crystallin family protein [Candidatus ainarchaeum sp.]MDD5096394.1 Hsp20/alpha crystallin family protein [Candidatus ainarchaeum sp.]
MADRRKRRPFGFFGLDDEGFGFGNEFERMREEMEEMMERMMKGMPQDEVKRLSQMRGPQVYGFSIRVGPDGKPVVTEFGDIKRKEQEMRALGGEERGTGLDNEGREGLHEGAGRERAQETGNRDGGNQKVSASYRRSDTEQETEGREPLVDVFRDKKGINVIAEMPGVGEKDVQLSVNGKELEIKAEGARKYYRKVELPDDVSGKKMEKKYRNGVLELVFS